MYANKVKKIAAVHDLSGMGRVSLTVVIPILSSMGFQVCPLPTAVLSNHTQYPGFSFLDLTDEMPKIIAQWKKLEVQFDAIYTGYLGSPKQIQIVSDFIKDFRQPDSLIVADPVLGDNCRWHWTVPHSLSCKVFVPLSGMNMITVRVFYWRKCFIIWICQYRWLVMN